MAIWYKDAEYLEQILPEYRGNPLIEALPEIMSREDTLECLTRTPDHDDSERNLDAKYRLHCVSRLLHDFYQPFPQHLTIQECISVCLRQGYRSRSPLGKDYAIMLNETYEAMKENRLPRRVPGYHPNASGFTIIGVSGVGKSTAVESVLAQYDQVIKHTEYHGQPFLATQLVWLKLDCPHDGSRGEFCYRFFKALDQTVGTSLLRRYEHSRIAIDSLLTLVAHYAQEYSLGLLVVDECQHLSLAKGGSEAMLNFFVTLVNTIGVPVILIGTSKARPLFQGSFRQARRASGHGDISWNRMQKNRSWTTFVESIWKYQWTRNKVPLTPEMLDAIYDETQGIIVMAVVLYVLVQEDAIGTERETFDARDIVRVSRERMTLVQPMLDALRKNDQKEIDRYEDITDILIDEVSSRLDKYQEIEIPEHHKLSGSAALTKLRNEILPFFVRMKKPPEVVNKLIEQVYQETKSTDVSDVLARVYDLLRKEEAAAENETAREKPVSKSEFREISELVDDTQW